MSTGVTGDEDEVANLGGLVAPTFQDGSRDFVVLTAKTDPPLTRRGVSGVGYLRKLFSELVELTGIEPVTS